MRILLAAGTDPTAQDEHCRTALHTAAMVNDAELLRVIFILCLYFDCDLSFLVAHMLWIVIALFPSDFNDMDNTSILFYP